MNNFNTDYERTGTICFVYNRVFWIIPNFCDLKKSSSFRSAPFSLLGSIWHLQFRPVRSVWNTSKKEWLEIAVKRLSKTCTLEEKRIRFGIAGSNLEISKTLVADDMPHYLPLVLSSDIESQKDEWLPEGNLRLFFAIETLYNDPESEKFQDSKTTEGNEDIIKIDRSTCVDVFSQTEEETGVWKLQQQLKEILLSGNVSDVLLRVGPQEFKVHKCILAARSPVFLAMFMHETKEKNTGVVDIEDIDADAFPNFLSYLYTGSMDIITSQNVVKLYLAADKYQVYEMKKVCTDYMLENISIDNFCDVLTLSLRHVEKDLTDACTQFFIENSLSIVLTTKWQIFLSENPVVANELYIKQLKMKK